GAGRGGRRGRMRRGEVRPALLIALLDGPAHGYELIQRLEALSGGQWRPSPGSVYPQLQLLADEGLVVGEDRDGKRVFSLTDAGSAEAEARKSADGNPWDEFDAGDRGGLRSATMGLHHAIKQVGITGSPDTITRATEIVTQARKDLYRLLAED
ncbi:MAG: PadR family transcriptional regulator, partial [Acidimicrobiales bacterium]